MISFPLPGVHVLSHFLNLSELLDNSFEGFLMNSVFSLTRCARRNADPSVALSLAVQSLEIERDLARSTPRRFVVKRDGSTKQKEDHLSG